MIPDLLAYWLTGSAGAEVTNASTTALLDVATRKWATGLIERAGIPRPVPGAAPAGRGHRANDQDGHRAQVLCAVPLVTVGSHDTASAVVAVPAEGPNFAYISSGTWSLVGMELTAPVLTRASLEANFTNEAGIDGTIRYLRNVTGLWLLQECLRHWGQAAPGSAAPSLDSLLDAAAAVEPLRFVIDADDPVFLPPGDMPGRIAAGWPSAAFPCPARRRRSCAASWTALPWPTGAP